MPRKPLILAAVIVALHLCEAATLGTSTAGSLLANLLQIFACGFAVVVALGAHRRGQGLSRPFWLLVATGVVMWGLANLGWMYYEVVLHTEPPTGSIVRFLFGLQGVFFAMALFLDEDKDAPNFDLESVLDFVQIAIVFFLIFVGFYYLPAHHFDDRAALARETRMETSEDMILLTISFIQTFRARTEGVRKLYAGLTLYLLFYTVCATLADYQQSIEPSPTSTLLDLAWTLPLLAVALWAAFWQTTPRNEAIPRLRRRAFNDLMLTNA